MKTRMVAYVKDLQDRICSGLESVDTVSFSEDTWTRPGGGGGRTRVISGGEVFEKGGVNVSEVFGTVHHDTQEGGMFRQLLSKQGITLDADEDIQFFATGLSLVIHPRSPLVPTTHANYRYFECERRSGERIWWFGGGADLTPYYLVEDDARHFHTVHQTICDAHDPSYYPIFKAWCDQYFTLTHRQETRGIGGLFFDYLNDRPQDELFAFIQECGHGFLDAYLPIVNAHKDTPFTDDQKKWQCVRRGRYAEFNLVYDRGTLFGLKTNGRIESILMSLPPEVHWDYNMTPEPGSPEAALVEVLKHPKEWVSLIPAE